MTAVTTERNVPTDQQPNRTAPLGWRSTLLRGTALFFAVIGVVNVFDGDPHTSGTAHLALFLVLIYIEWVIDLERRVKRLEDRSGDGQPR